METIKKSNFSIGILFFSVIIGVIVLTVVFNKIYENGMDETTNAIIGILLSIIFVYLVYTVSSENMDIMGHLVNKGMGLYVLIILFIFFAFSSG
jgi:uncharacterized protein YacL